MLFFFQAEDGIRDGHVTGVQTCALPIYRQREAITGYLDELRSLLGQDPAPNEQMLARVAEVEEELHAATDEMESIERSEERRVGKECRNRGWTENENERDIE